jgi:hypothetical protein
MRFGSTLRFSLAAIAAAGISATGVAGVMRLIIARGPADVRSLQNEAGYRVATRFYQGSLSPPAARLLHRLRDADQTAVVVVLRARDTETCEDLGRQLRELQRAIGRNRPLLIFAEPTRSSVIRNFVRSERLANVRIGEIATATIYAGKATLMTPAVLLVDRADSVVEGVAHPVRFPDARVRSFTEELKSLQAR